MKHKGKRPSPAFVVSIIALVMAMTGSAIAAVDFARNAGAVDGKSAVGAGSSVSGAKGRLVAMAAGGSQAGTLPGKFVSGVIKGAGGISSFSRAQDVVDNQVGAALTLIDFPGLGTITSVCSDQAGQVGKEDPAQTISFSNRSGAAVSYARSVGNGASAISVPQSGTQTGLTIRGSNTFEIFVQRGLTTVTIRGIARQDGAGSAGAQCFTTAQAIVSG